jgi:two-component sensor histidine kinase
MAQRRKLFARRRDGSEFPVEIGPTPMSTPEGFRVLATINDVSVREEARRAVEQALSEKTALLNEVHHRVKNNLQVISSLLNMQARNASPELRAGLAESQGRVKAMALIHQLLYERNDFSRIELGPYLERLCALLRASHLDGRNEVSLQLEARDSNISLDLQRAVPCGLLVNELITNAIKHAVPDGRSGRVRIELAALNDGRGELVVADDGVGLPADLEPGNTRSLGFQLIPALVDQVEASLEIDRSAGTRYALRFPAAARS